MGEKSDAKLMYSIDGKEFREIGEIPELIISHNDTTSQFFSGGEMTFSCNINPLALLGIILDEATLIKYFQSIKSNNWLRRHGLPMRRKIKTCQR